MWLCLKINNTQLLPLKILRILICLKINTYDKISTWREPMPKRESGRATRKLVEKLSEVSDVSCEIHPEITTNSFELTSSSFKK